MERVKESVATASPKSFSVNRSAPQTEVAPAEEKHFQGKWLGSLGGLAFFAGVSFAAAAVGGLVTKRPKNKFWYRLLRKSDYTPPDRAFAIVWPVLYSLGAYSAWRVARTEPSAARTKALALWGVQIASNAAWSPLFFGAHMPKAAMADLGANYASMSAYAYQARKVDKIAFAAALPTMGWLTFAGTLNGAVILKKQLPGL